MTVVLFKIVLIEIIWDIFYFPLWWYSRGLVKSGLFFWYKLVWGVQTIGVHIWLKNIFKPMYGQADWQSRLISFFMRLIQIVFRLIALIIWTVLVVVFYLAWLMLPIFIIYMFFNSF